MGYRDPSPPEPTRVPWGRFRASRGEWLLALFVLTSLLLTVAVSLDVWTFRCVRDAAEAVRCEDTRSMAGLMERRRVFEGEWLSSIEWVPVRARRDRGRTELVDSRGAPAEVLSDDRDDAREWHQRLDRFLEDSSERELVIEERVSPAGLVTAAVLLAWLFLVLRGLIRTTGRYEVLVDQAAGRIVVRATRLGLFSFNRVLPLEGLRGIDVAHGLLRRQHHPRGNEGEPAANAL